MKNTYIHPLTDVVSVPILTPILAGSGMPIDGGKEQELAW